MVVRGCRQPVLINVGGFAGRVRFFPTTGTSRGSGQLCTEPHTRRPASLQRKHNQTSNKSISARQSSRVLCTSLTANSSVSATPTPISQSYHTLPDGLRLEVLSCSPTAGESRSPLVFVHGSYHAAWCWAERWMPFFREAGFPCYAVSLRGQGGSDKPDKKVGGTLSSHAADVVHYLQSMPAAKPPVLIAHSMGGAVVQYILGMAPAADRQMAGRPALAGVALLASAPPSGSSSIVGRMFKATPMLAAKVTWAFISANFTKDLAACRLMFFSDSLPTSDLDRYQKLLAANYNAIPVIDVRNVRHEFPPPRPVAPVPPVFVGGGDNDNVVDVDALQEMAEWVGLQQAVIVDDMAHDVMLDTKWQEMANELLKFLQEL